MLGGPLRGIIKKQEVYMFFCIAALLEDDIQNEIRRHVNKINRENNVSVKASLLPQHISLKISFNTDRIEKLEQYFDNIEIENEIFIESNGIELLEQPENGNNSGLIWININENKELRNLHNKLNNDLPKILDISNSWIDGDYFRFHSTIIMGNRNYEEYQIIYKSFLTDYKDFKTQIKKIALLCSHENKITPGTFYQYKVKHLTTAST